MSNLNKEDKKIWEQRNPEKVRKHRRKSNLKRWYGLTPEQHDAMIEKQKGICAICLNVFDALVIDHCHKTGKVRELLCRSCNLTLGHAKESKEILENSIKYLEKHGL